MAAPDYRIRFSAGSVDFTADVGLTGQDHDDYPAPNTQARYDWMRLVIIGLLSHQASTTEPTQYRMGTVWFDLNENCFKVYMGATDGWQPLAKAINIAEAGTTIQTVWDLARRVETLETRVAALER